MCDRKLNRESLCVSGQDLPAPTTIAEALQQRMDVYKSAAEGAKNKGDDRKARMHQRIAKVTPENIMFTFVFTVSSFQNLWISVFITTVAI